MVSTNAVLAALKTYAQTVHASLGIPGAPAAWPEDQLKSPMKVLLESIGTMLGHTVIVTTESPQPGGDGETSGGRVDAAVQVGKTTGTALLTGHVELKAPNKPGDPRKLTAKHDVDQWAKFQRLPNLIYTNGREWTLQRTGTEISRFTLSGDPVHAGEGAVNTEDAESFRAFIETFFLWEPIPPKTSKQLAELLAPLCRLLRAEVLESLASDSSALTRLAREVRKYLFGNASNETVADAFAQTYTYSLLIARMEGADPLTVSEAERVLNDGHGLLSEVLGLLDSPDAHIEVQTSADTILRVLRAVQPHTVVTKHGDNPWLYFYEEFLSAYDPALRKQVGAYYTPAEVVRAQVAMVQELLVSRFGKPKAFADPDVVTLDPAVGTGTYPLHILQTVAEAVPAQALGSTPAVLRQAAANLFGFEYLIGPYSVAHLRLSRFLADHGVETTAQDPLQILLADTLASHEQDADLELPEVYGFEEIREEQEAARALKANQRVVVCIGNPPYLRGTKLGPDGALGGWVAMRRMPRKGEKVRDPETGRRVADKGQIGIIKDFTEPVLSAGHGGDLNNLYNAYVYFWRWALWKVFEQARSAEASDGSSSNGVVSFITASSFIRGPGFAGMRQHMRSVLDEIWIIDLGGDNKGGRRTENVFAIETPVAITLGVRYGDPDPSTPATVHYVSLADLTAAQKRAQLAALTGFSDGSLNWTETLAGWQDPFLPVADAGYLSWPALTDLFPWQTGGSQVKRSWPIGETPAVLESRWAQLTGPLPPDLQTGNAAADASTRTRRRAELLKETRDRRINAEYADLFDPAVRMPALSTAIVGSKPQIRPYAYRSFDRQFIIADNRVGDFLRPTLWRSHSEHQRYLVSLLTKVLGRGPAAVVSADVPDLDSFSNRGGRDVIPLWKDAAATVANVTDGLLDAISSGLGRTLHHRELFEYCYGLLAPSAYVDRFWDALTIPGPRIPITKDEALFTRVSEHGKRLITLHTDGLHDLDVITTDSPGTAVYSSAISDTQYPETYAYDEGSRTLRVGDGEYTSVAPEIWGYAVSGLKVVESWLAYRKLKRAGKSSSKLDEIRPKSWPDTDGQQLLRLLWTLEATIAAEETGAALLDTVIASELFLAVDLPQPNDVERAPADLKAADDSQFETAF